MKQVGEQLESSLGNTSLFNARINVTFLTVSLFWRLILIQQRLKGSRDGQKERLVRNSKVDKTGHLQIICTLQMNHNGETSMLQGKVVKLFLEGHQPCSRMSTLLKSSFSDPDLILIQLIRVL